MKKRLLYTILSISLLTVMAGAAIAPALGVISAHFEGRNPLLIQLIVSLPALFIILTNLAFPLLCRLMKTRALALSGLELCFPCVSARSDCHRPGRAVSAR